MLPRTLLAVAATALLATLAIACTPQTDLKDQNVAPEASSKGVTESAPASVADPLAAVLVEPPAGSADIPPNLAALVVQFVEPVQSSSGEPPFVLRSAAGDAVSVAMGSTIDCAGTCYMLVPASALMPSTSYTLEASEGGLQFLDSKPIPSGRVGTFSTAAAADVFVPRILSSTLALAEGCASVHVATDEAVQIEVMFVAGSSQAVISHAVFRASADFAERLPDLPAGIASQATLRAVDRAGNSTTSAPVDVQLPPHLPALVISEVLANPAGSETTQEFVELYNRGDSSEDLGGLRLADKSGSDVLPQAALAPGAYAVVVPEGFSVDGKDPAPRDGAVVVRVSGRLGSDGLSNTGEPVRLLTAKDEVISQYGGWVDVSATAWSGKSVKRLRPDICDSADAWSKSPSAPTPGW
jgi:Lamin Tail Domain